MKRMTCKELDGVCDEIITGNTSDEMMKNSQKHAMSANDEAHQNKMKEMASMPGDPEAVKRFMSDFEAKFEAAPEI